ncbi:glycoside hydrolase family 13 and glycosyltransferase family 5 protein [Hysterangium stoloniferum]|nr:glycoside hydrolase family 13 and glycosyltransferase family 5 protein [Hysterangium stoloniferum]
MRIQLLEWHNNYLSAHVAIILSLLLSQVSAIAFRADLVPYNLNTNQQAQSVLEYDTSRPNQTYTPSPANWRALPFYTVLLDKFADGDPSNNDFFRTPYENDWRETGLRYGGDLKGLQSRLDYLQGMGIKSIFIAGTGFLNMPWQADSYSVIDFSLLDPHWGNTDDWRNLIDAIHARGMYIMMDFTVGTMADYVGFAGHLNVSTPFSTDQYQTQWKLPRYAPWGLNTYPDFDISNTWNSSCRLPVLWQEDGTEVDQSTISFSGCYTSEFDQFGDMEAFGVHPDWQRQLSKFASVQDRLREWDPNVMQKIKKYSCLTIKALDIDGIRVDKATQITVDALASWTASTKACAAAVGKNNFFVVGEVTGGDTFGSLYIGRGRTPTQKPPGFLEAANVTKIDNQFFLRDSPRTALDGIAFHYSVYRSLTRFLGMDGNLDVAFDVNSNFVTAWNEMMVDNDFLNSDTGLLDPRHMYGVSNFDVFRWPSLVNGTQRLALATFITTLLMPGIPLYYYGEEQNFYLYDNGASNYLFGRQAMSSSTAWQKHGCYKMGSDQYFNIPIEKALLGCQDDWNSLDHFDPTAPTRRLMAHFNYLRSVYPALQDGLNLVQRGNWTHFVQLPGSNHTETELGWWSASRSGIPNVQNFTGNHSTDQIWLIYTNENATQSYQFDCNGPLWISSPYPSGTTVRNLLPPYETYSLQDSKDSFNKDGQAPWTGCLPNVTLPPYSFKALVPVGSWVTSLPMMTKFTPGHDHRIQAEDGDANATNVDISFEFNVPMSCDSVTNSLSFRTNSGMPTFDKSAVVCAAVNTPDPVIVPGTDVSAWSWSVTLNNVPDGIIQLTVTNPATQDGTVTTGTTDHVLLRKGSSKNVMVFPNADYDNSAFEASGNDFTFTHNAFGAELLRYTADYGQSWSNWTSWENVTTIPGSTFSGKFWDGQHIMMQYWSSLTTSSTQVVHADHNSKWQRRVPQFLARGPFNTWGFDNGIPSQMQHTGDGKWELEIMASWPTYVQLNVFGFDDYFYGDTDGDGVLERLPPNSAAPNYVNMSAPPHPHLAWALVVDDSTLSWSLEPRGFAVIGAVMYALLLAIPLITGVLAVLIFRWSFYGIRYNQWGMKPKEPSNYYFPIMGGGSLKGSEKMASTPMSEMIFGARPTGGPIGWPELKGKRREVLIATLEYEIMDWKLKVKIGGLGVMSSLMGKAMTDVDLIWVIPKVKDLEYPPGEPAEPIEVVIFGEPYLIEVETHVLDNITYVLLDSPVFRAQTKSDPYPARMDDLSSAIFYSTWNQAIATTIRRFPAIDIYHVNDYHGALAPIYLLPKVIPVCLSLHNAEFQGLWPLRTKEEMKEVCSAFNISKEHCRKYVQFGNTFNLLHAAASFISVHQKSVGVAGVSDKYGKRSWARYPALWTLKHVDSLPNPDPSDIEALDEKPVDLAHIQIDEAAEAARPEFKRQAQEWAGIKQDPNSDLFVFVGRWSKQKGVDLIADVMPSLLTKRSSVQLIAVGPVIDLYGRFAAEKLARLMEMYPDRVFSKPEFTALPPYLFSGADFALIPSRDEPFGLVAVEFGRKGALGVGSRLGGLGLMPGWWFPVESSSTAHMLSQLTKTIKMALKSTHEERAILRARSAVQRFPVVEWRQRMEDFHRRSISTSRGVAGVDAWRPADGRSQNLGPNVGPEGEVAFWDSGVPAASISRDGSPVRRSREALNDQDDLLTAPRRPRRGSFSTDVSEDESTRHSRDGTEGRPDFGGFLARANRQIAKDQRHVADPFLSTTPVLNRPFGLHSRASSVESIASIVDEKTDSPLNKAIATFTDADGEVVQDFVLKLQDLSTDNSKGDLSIEKFLTKSEEKFFDRVRRDRLSSAASIRSSNQSILESRPTSPTNFSSIYHQEGGTAYNTQDYSGPLMNHDPALDGVVMTKTQIALQREIGGWPLYTIILALGQMLGATSFQITLLSGQNWQNNLQLYVLGGIFLVASGVWYTLFRLKPSIYVLAFPWIFYGVAFFLIGLPSISHIFVTKSQIVTNVATWCYAIASAAAFLYFGLNFGEEAGAATEVWTLRACVVQGSQQIWVTALWYWGSQLSGVTPGNAAPPWWIVLILWPLAVMCIVFFWLMLKGLPEYYRQVPPKVPNFMKTLFRRKLVLWFLASEVLRDYWLSGPYGRNWTFLWSAPIPKLAILGLVIAFFVVVWGIMLWILTYFSKTHTWLLPVFAVGLGAPRWCQMLWGTSSLALYIPWAGKSGPYLGTSLWLWLGVLDAIQGVGLGMILLQTLSRLHVCATLAFAQVIGSVCVMIARATAPNRVGPGTVFPDAAKWDFTGGLKGSPMEFAPFWIAMICQIVIVIGYFWFYRKEQLSRP